MDENGQIIVESNHCITENAITDYGVAVSQSNLFHFH